MADELQRRLVHASGTAVPVAYLLGVLPWRAVQWLLLVGSAVAVVLEALRLSGVVEWMVFDRLTREYEQENLAGYALYAFGLTAVALAFEPRVAVPATLMLTVADPISGLLGSGSLGKRAPVLFVTFGVCVFIAAWFVPLVVAVVGAVTATLADGAKPVVAGYVVDDNLTIPIGAGVVMWLGLRYLPASVPAV